MNRPKIKRMRARMGHLQSAWSMAHGVIYLSLLIMAGTEPAEAIVRIDAFYLPHFTTREDKNDYLPVDLGLNADLKQGSGIGLRLAIDTLDPFDVIEAVTPVTFGFGLLYMNNSHDIKNSPKEVGVHSFYIEPLLKYTVNDDYPLFFIEGGVGFGGMYFDFSNSGGDRLGTAAEIRFGVGMQFTPWTSIELGAGQYIWGLPGETVARGGFTTVGIHVQF